MFSINLPTLFLNNQLGHYIIIGRLQVHVEALDGTAEPVYKLHAFDHRDRSTHIDTANTRLFDMGLTSAEGQKLESFDKL